MSIPERLSWKEKRLHQKPRKRQIWWRRPDYLRLCMVALRHTRFPLSFAEILLSLVREEGINSSHIAIYRDQTP